MEKAALRVRDIFSRLNKYEIRIRKAVNSHQMGNFSSIFKGTGLEFSDLRTYQYGDDVRTIDWITTAKGHGAFVKIFKEEKEQTVFCMVDVSASQEVGSEGQQKIDRAKEIAGVLSLSAVREGAQVGLYGFSDQKEFYLKASTGMKHVYTLVSKLFSLNPFSTQTSLSNAIAFVFKILKRKSVVILISDFRDQGYDKELKGLARKHDLVVVHLYDDREVNLPSLGIIPVYDKERQKTSWVNTSLESFKSKLASSVHDKKVHLESLCRTNGASYIAISSTEDFESKLIELFRVKR